MALDKKKYIEKICRLFFVYFLDTTNDFELVIKTN